MGDTKRAEVIQSQDVKFKQLSKFLGSKKFLMGNAVTVADFAMYDALKWYQALDANIVSKHNNIVKYLDNFEKIPKITSFFKSPNFKNNFFPPAAKWNGSAKL